LSKREVTLDSAIKEILGACKSVEDVRKLHEMIHGVQIWSDRLYETISLEEALDRTKIILQSLGIDGLRSLLDAMGIEEKVTIKRPAPARRPIVRKCPRCKRFVGKSNVCKCGYVLEEPPQE